MNKHRSVWGLRSGVFVVYVAFFLMGCASVPPAASPAVSLPHDEGVLKSAHIDPRARTIFAQAEKSLKAKKYKAALDNYRAIKNQFPGTQEQQLAAYRIGSLYYNTGNYPQASQEFQNFLTRFPQSDLAFDVSYNLAATEFQQTHYEKAYEALRRLSPESIRAQGPRRSEYVFQLAIQTAQQLRNPGGALLYSSYYLQSPLEEGKRRQVETAAKNYLSQIQSADELQTLLAQVSEPTTRDRIQEKLATFGGTGATAQSAGLPSVAPLTEGAEPTGSASLAPATSADKTHIGVILPLSGSLAAYGRKALDGILLAAGVFRKEGGRDLELFIEDSASNPAVAAQAVELLYHEHNVIGIVGPISWKESLAVADKAQELGVLNLSLAGKEGISERGAYLFQNALTPRIQMESLVNHCVREKHFRRFAILAPENKFGEDMAVEFTTVANKLGGRVVGYEKYPPEAKDFQQAVQKLVGVSDPRDRKDSPKFDQYMKEQAQKSKRPSKARLPPIKDFDALFIPDGPKAVAQIAASLAYFDVTGVTLLGTSEWNNSQLYKRGGRLVEGAIFPAGLLLSENYPKQRDFLRQYTDSYGGTPDLLAAQAYEALELVAQAAEGSSGNRNSAVQALLSMGQFESPLGILSFDASRVASRTLHILTLSPGGSVVVQ